MAQTSLISISVFDAAGKGDTVRVFVPGTTTLAEVGAIVTAFAPILDVVTGGAIKSASVQLPLTLPGGLKANATADSLRQTGANFSFRAANTNYRHTLRVPAIDLSLIDNGVLTDAGGVLQNLTDYMLVGTGGVGPTDEYANDLNALIGQELSFRK